MCFAQRGRSSDPPFVITLTHNGFGISHEGIFITTQLLNVCCDVLFFITIMYLESGQACSIFFLCHGLMKMSQTTQAITGLLFLNWQLYLCCVCLFGLIQMCFPHITNCRGIFVCLTAAVQSQDSAALLST